MVGGLGLLQVAFTAKQLQVWNCPLTRHGASKGGHGASKTRTYTN